MGQYDDPALADLDHYSKPLSPLTRDIMLMSSGVGEDIIKKPADFSLMADNFATPSLAMRAHVPGINVMFRDGHVGWFEDTTENGDILYYGNGITNLYNFDWEYDDIWMIIDGYHQPPVGQ